MTAFQTLTPMFNSLPQETQWEVVDFVSFLQAKVKQHLSVLAEPRKTQASVTDKLNSVYAEVDSHLPEDMMLAQMEILDEDW
jgi:hypothetical protein